MSGSRSTSYGTTTSKHCREAPAPRARAMIAWLEQPRARASLGAPSAASAWVTATASTPRAARSTGTWTSACPPTGARLAEADRACCWRPTGPRTSTRWHVAWASRSSSGTAGRGGPARSGMRPRTRSCFDRRGRPRKHVDYTPGPPQPRAHRPLARGRAQCAPRSAALTSRGPMPDLSPINRDRDRGGPRPLHRVRRLRGQRARRVPARRRGQGRGGGPRRGAHDDVIQAAANCPVTAITVTGESGDLYP